jgi:exopolyphosphatase/guanosine-5'-triphosphate,3'-diphosphate pyrophosphatase
MQLAAIDIGTNSIHMIVVRVRPDRSFEVVGSEKAMVRLGAGGLDGKALTEEAMQAALQTLSTFKRLCESFSVDHIEAAATSAVREAKNGGEFLARVEHEVGVRPKVISGAEEARLIHQAAMYGADIGRGRAVVVDIGGGSVEITLGTAAAIKMAKSFKVGVIRLTERFVQSDPLSARDERQLVKHVRSEVGRFCERIKAAGFDRVLGTSGTILSLGTVVAASRGTTPDLRNLRVTVKQLHKVRETVTRLDADERLTIPGLEPRRVDLVVAGAVLLDTILERLGATELTLCDLALREGLVLDYVRRHRRAIVQVDQIPDVRRRSTIELAERCNYSAEHARQVARIALALYDQTQQVHELGEREREWLEYAAIMHDLGVHISYPRHHHHSYYLIKNGDLRGFDPDETEVIGLLARYHRRGEPKRSDEDFARLPSKLRKAVRKLAPMLRLAESLDRSHAQVVNSLTLRDRGRDYLLRLRSTTDAELEVWAANANLEPFENLLGKPVRVEASSQREPERIATRRTKQLAS